MGIATLGHSTHTPERFIEICRAARLEVIVDVRSHPSSKWEWWHEGHMDWLAEAGIELRWEPRLGGWDQRHRELVEWASPRGVDLRPYLRGYFPKNRIGVATDGASEDRPAWRSKWTSQGLHDYAWYTATDEFNDGLDELVATYAGPTQPRAAVMCAELLWWKCHRSMVADVLAAGHGVLATHLTPQKLNVRADPHRLSDRIERYPAEVRAAWADPEVRV